MPITESKEKYWEWRANNNPFENPSRRGYKPGFFENRPGRRILFLYVPIMVGNFTLLKWYTILKNRRGEGVISIPYSILTDEPIKSFWD